RHRHASPRPQRRRRQGGLAPEGRRRPRRGGDGLRRLSTGRPARERYGLARLRRASVALARHRQSAAAYRQRGHRRRARPDAGSVVASFGGFAMIGDLYRKLVAMGASPADIADLLDIASRGIAQTPTAPEAL